MSFQMKKADDDKAVIAGVFSNEKEDRHGDVVKQEFDLKMYKKNPVILDSHNYSEASAVVGKASKLKVVDKQLVGDIEFAVDANPRAKIIYDLYKGGFLNAFSIGFIPKEWSDKGEILKSELLEISAVSVPANAWALAKAKGINVDGLYEKSEDEDIAPEDEEDDTSGGDELDGEGEATPENEAETDGDGGEADGEESDEDVQGDDEEPGTGDETEEEGSEEDVEEEVEEVVEETPEQKRLKRIKRINSAIDLICEKSKGRNTDNSVKAETNRSINRAVRKLLKLKK